MTETELLIAIMEAASDAGHRLHRNNVGKARYAKGGRQSVVPYGVGGVGAPDLMGWSRDGMFIAVEVKRPGQKPRPEQDAWRVKARRSCPGLRIGWADNIEDAMAICEGRLAN